ncbi:hypothetical protein D3C86_2062590 [compost metagenome]
MVEVESRNRAAFDHCQANTFHAALNSGGLRLLKRHEERHFLKRSLADLYTAHAGEPAALSAGLGVMRNL